MDTADTLRRAAELLRLRATTEATLREGDPYYSFEVMPDGSTVTEQSAWERVVTPEVGLAVADLLDRWAWMAAKFPDQLHRVDADGVVNIARALLKKDPR
jgi:hypothetical protein